MIITVRGDEVLSLFMSSKRLDLDLPFLPPAMSVASRITESRSIRPALRRALTASDLPLGDADCVDTDIAIRSVQTCCLRWRFWFKRVWRLMWNTTKGCESSTV